MDTRALPGRRTIFAFIFLIAALLLASGCSLGPKALKGNRIDYNISIHKSNNEDLLVNLVRASYFEPIFFLQVGSVSSSFNYGATVGAKGTLTEFRSPSAPNYVETSVGASFSEVPTITYAPLQGSQAIRQLIAEIPPDRFLLLSRSGWSIAAMLWTTVHHIGPLYNYSNNWPKDHPLIGSYRGFLELSAIWGGMQNREELDLPGLDKDSGGLPVIPVLMKFQNAQDAEKIDRLLGIKSEKTALPDGRLKAKVNLALRCDTGVASCVPIKMKSFFNVLYDISQIGVQDNDKRIPWMKALPDDLRSRRGLHSGLIHVRASSASPAGAYVAVNYRGAWHYIAEEDFNSRAFFSLLGLLFSLQSAEIPVAQPLLTIPTR
jgi:hypothetical protein